MCPLSLPHHHLPQWHWHFFTVKMGVLFWALLQLRFCLLETKSGGYIFTKDLIKTHLGKYILFLLPSCRSFGQSIRYCSVKDGQVTVRAGPGSLTPRKEVSGALSCVNSMCHSAIHVTWGVLPLFIPFENTKNKIESQVNLRNKNYLSVCLKLVCSFWYLSTKKDGNSYF